MSQPESFRRTALLTVALSVLVLLIGSTFGAVAAASTDNGSQQSRGDCLDADAGDNRHPSGKDRSCETGSVGKSSSDPDGNENGGADKSGGTGGVDRADQDGNNGCGNDDDFEDDNNGNCGGRRRAAGAGETGNAGEIASAGRRNAPAVRQTTASSVLPARIARPAVAPSVLGENRVRRPAALAVTGPTAFLRWPALACLALGLGAILYRTGGLRREERPQRDHARFDDRG